MGIKTEKLLAFVISGGCGRDCVRLPGSVLRAAVDVGAVVQQVLDDGEPAAGARLVQGAVPGVVPVVDLTHAVLQTVEHHLLAGGRDRKEGGD